MTRLLLACALVFASMPSASGQDPRPPSGNRLTYLDENDPYYVSGAFPRLATPQWIGEEGVELALILSIDDLRDPAKYEAFLRPLLDRLKKIDGRAPVSIMSNTLDPLHPQLQTWLQEGVSLENHTFTHPHPLLRDGNFEKARGEVDRCTEMLFQIPNNRPVAFRTPWCDVLNTVSPRFFSEIFNGTTEKGRFLTIDSSIFTLLSPKEKFARYLAHVPNYANTVDDYPYPYVIGRLCWEFPCVVPDDSVAQRLNKPNSPETVRDLQATVDIVAARQGTWTLVFHPHNWIRNTQLVDVVDYAVGRHGTKARFLTFREAQERIDRHLLDGHPLRDAAGKDNGVRLIDLDADGFLDVLIGNGAARKTRLWKADARRWEESGLPVALADGGAETGVRFGVIRPDGRASMILRTETAAGGWTFDGARWNEDPALLAGLELDGKPVLTRSAGRDRGVRMRDVNNDGRCELIVGNEGQNAVFGWSPEQRRWNRLSWALPRGTSIVDAAGRDAGLRFADVNGDGHVDVVFSNAEKYSVDLYIPKPNALRAFPQMGWTRPTQVGRRGDPGEIPPIVRGDGSANGAWFHSAKLWVQNEDTTKLPEHCDRRTFGELTVGYLPPPLTPQQSLKRIQARPGFKVELVASEPLVHDPVAFEWGPDGKLWVVEMLDYPWGIDGKGRAGGKVRFLEDTDGDGTYDRSTIFLEGLNFPTGVMPWRKGVLVSAAPEVFYAEDTDGDGRADLRRTLLSGFGEGNQQHRVNGFQYGLDNWVHGANGGSGGTILSHPGGRTVRINGRDFRFRPDDGALEAQAGVTEFGRNRDDWGNWFGNNHPIWGWHYFLPEHYLARNPQLAARTNKTILGMDAQLINRRSRLMARPQMARMLDHVTAPCCVSPYRDELFGEGFASAVFISEPDKNVVRRFNLVPQGATFSARRPDDERDREFLASDDNWFRPTMSRTGPDGALYIADMYRLIIEHAEYYPEDMRDLVDFRAGHDRGRIYRVSPEGAARRRVPRLIGQGPVELAAALESPNGWQRDTAQRLIVHAGDRSAAGPLERLAKGSPAPKTRLQALCTLDGLNALTAEILAGALNDAHPSVRAHAVRLSEPILRAGDVAAPLADALLARAEDPDAGVRYQSAFTLGEWRDARAARALARLAVTHSGDDALQQAVLSSAVPHVGGMLEALLAEPSPRADLVGRVLSLSAEDAVHARALEQVAQAREGRYAPWQLEALGVYLESRGKAPPPALEAVLAHARILAADPSAPEADRLKAVALLGRGAEADFELLGGLLGAGVPTPVQRSALTRLRSAAGPSVAGALAARWKEFGPALRGDVLDLLFARSEGREALLGALERGVIAPGELEIARQQQLIGDAALRGRATKVFGAVNPDRQKIVGLYRDLIEFRTTGQLKGNAARGLEHFRKNCASCHRVKDIGHAVGPDLGQSAAKPAGELLAAILDPNQSISSGYTAYRIETKDDRDLSGVVAAETPNSVTLRMANGVEEVLRRDQIRRMSASSLSLMPEGLEKSMTPQDVADLIAFLQQR